METDEYWFSEHQLVTEGDKKVSDLCQSMGKYGGTASI